MAEAVVSSFHPPQPPWPLRLCWPRVRVRVRPFPTLHCAKYKRRQKRKHKHKHNYKRKHKRTHKHTHTHTNTNANANTNIHTPTQMQTQLKHKHGCKRHYNYKYNHEHEPNYRFNKQLNNCSHDSRARDCQRFGSPDRAGDSGRPRRRPPLLPCRRIHAFSALPKRICLNAAVVDLSCVLIVLLLVCYCAARC
jgi:hypothetical protein